MLHWLLLWGAYGASGAPVVPVDVTAVDRSSRRITLVRDDSRPARLLRVADASRRNISVT